MSRPSSSSSRAAAATAVDAACAFADGSLPCFGRLVADAECVRPFSPRPAEWGGAEASVRLDRAGEDRPTMENAEEEEEEEVEMAEEAGSALASVSGSGEADDVG